MTDKLQRTARPPSDAIAGSGLRFTMRTFIDLFGPLIGLAGVFFLFAILVPWQGGGGQTFVTVDNIRVMLVQTAVIAMVALGMTYVIIGAGIDLSVGSTIALSCCVVAMLIRDNAAITWDGWHWIPAMAMGVLAGGLVGAFNGSLITLMRLPPFIVTLATFAAVRGLAKGVTNQDGVYPARADFTWITRSMASDGGGFFLPLAVWFVLIAAILFAAVLRYTRFGRHVVAVGSNEHTAKLCGVRVNVVKLFVYVIVGLCAGIAGVMQFGYISMGDPNTAMAYELSVIAAVVIGGASLSGGRGTILGTLAGAMIMTVVANGCTKLGLQNWVQEIITGGIIIGAVMLDRLRRLTADS